MKDILCLSPVWWAWIPIVLWGSIVATVLLIHFSEKKKFILAGMFAMGTLVLTIFAAYPFFLMWLRK